MKALAPVITAVVGAVVGVLVALGLNAAISENTVPEPQTPPAEQSLFGQVEYGSRG